MIKFNDKLERKQWRTSQNGFLVAQLLSRDMKTKINQQKMTKQ